MNASGGHSQAGSAHRWVLAFALMLTGIAVVGCTSDERSTQTREEATADGRKAYETGDYETAYDELYPIAKTGDPLSEFYIGRMYHFGEGRERNIANAIKWYRKSAEAGAKLAQYNLGIIYITVDDYKDYEKAEKWFAKSANNGHVQSMYNLGQLRSNKEDYESAVKWTKLAAENGVKEANFAVGTYYENGYGVAVNSRKALEFYRRSARQGYAPAMVNIAVMYDKGSGVERDLRKVYQWFSLAADHDWDGAEEEVRKLERALDRQGLEEARSMTSRWRDEHFAE